MAEGGGDLVECLAFPLPMEVTRLLFGVDPADWDTSVVALFDPRRRSGLGWVDDMQRLTDSLRGVVAAHRAGTAPPTGLFAALGATDDDGHGLTEFEQLANAVLLVTAGFETTMGLLTNAVRTLLLHPDQLALLLDDPSLASRPRSTRCCASSRPRSSPRGTRPRRSRSPAPSSPPAPT